MRRKVVIIVMRNWQPLIRNLLRNYGMMISKPFQNPAMHFVNRLINGEG